MHFDFLYRLRKNKTLVNGGLFSLYSFINQGISFFLLIILAKYILPDDYGRLSLFHTVLTLLGYFMAFSTAGYMGVSYFRYDAEEFKKDFTSIICLAIFSLFLFSFLATIIYIWGVVDFGFPSYLLWWASLISFFMCIMTMYLDYLRIQEKVIPCGFISCGNAILNFIISLLFVVTYHQGWFGRLQAQLICALAFGVLSFILFARSGLFEFELSKERFKKILFWGVPLIPHLSSIWIRQGCDRYIINYFYSVYDVGLFSFALNLTSIIIMIGVAFNQTNSVSIYQILGSKTIENKWLVLKKQTRMILFIYIVATLLVVMAMTILVPFVLPKYSKSLPYFSILAVYGFLQCLYFLVCNYLFYYEKTKSLMYITFGSSIFHLLMSMSFTRFSLICTCVVYVVTQSVIVLLVGRKSWLVLKENVAN